MDDEEIILRLEQRVQKLEHGFSVWKGGKSAALLFISVVLILVGGIWKSTLAPLRSDIKGNKAIISSMNRTLNAQSDRLSTVLILTARDRETLDDIDKRLDKAFQMLNQIMPYPGN